MKIVKPISFRLKTKVESHPLLNEEAIHERIDASMERTAFRFPPRPKDGKGENLDPALPPDLTSLNDVRLGKLFGEFAAMAQWCQLRLAQQSVRTSVKRRLDKMVRAKTRLQKTGTNSDKDNRTEVDPRVREVTHDLLVEESVESLTQAMMNGYLIGRDATSREMTRRIAMRENHPEPTQRRRPIG